MRRAQVLAFSGQGMRVQEIARSLSMHEEYVRDLIRQFNDDGFDALKPRPRTGRPKALSEEEISVVVEIATAPPQAFGRPFNQWSLRKLRQFLLDRKLIPPVTVPTLRSVLKERQVSFQRTRTWKRSNDPDFDAKKNGSPHSTAKRRKDRR
jgi:transposase